MQDDGWWSARGDGTPGRLDAWYATVTDRSTGTGLWIHGEVVTPTPRGEGDDPAAEPPWPEGAHAVSHGWAAVFPEGDEPDWARTPRLVEEEPGEPPVEGTAPVGFRTPDLRIDTAGSSGTAGDLSWELEWDASDQVGLSTFPAWAWDRGVFPGAQVVPAPDLEVTGWVARDGNRMPIDGHGQVGRVFGHGNARRWGWLHAEPGDGALIELVTAVSTKPLLRRLPPITFLRLRLDGTEWPHTRVACWGLRADLRLPRWSVSGRTHGVDVGIEVHQPAHSSVSVDYVDPDGDTATCVNSERADVEVSLRSQDGRERRWTVEGTGHAELGSRP